MVHTGRGRQFYLGCSVAARPPASLTWSQRPGRRRAPGHQADMQPMFDDDQIGNCYYSHLQIISVSPNMGNRSAYQVTVRGNTSYLFVSNVSAADFGEYVCRANNSIGLSSASIVVVGMYNQICKQCLAMFGSQCFQ